MDFSKAVFVGLGVTPDIRHVGGRRSLVAWAGEESGWHTPCDGVHGAAYNILNTTLVIPNCTSVHPYNDVPVQNYLSFNCGVDATVATLKESRYDHLRSVLLKPFVTGKTVLFAVADSDWGTFKIPVGEPGAGGPDYAAASALYDTYLNGRNKFNVVSVG